MMMMIMKMMIMMMRLMVMMIIISMIILAIFKSLKTSRMILACRISVTHVFVSQIDTTYGRAL